MTPHMVPVGLRSNNDLDGNASIVAAMEPYARPWRIALDWATGYGELLSSPENEHHWLIPLAWI
ncbi:hypothetical protein SCP_0411320 [Sparassis crispa]|uniref:Uncharacterized protein n=1 Tax=Sparassis crispa TaxID=139825 RepID=A0A401GKP9_9APHY|nr:hypothetical protein SCP_0411320 [Sparassis crispa]GBE82747.1 hypothetical protein SCP_0411320 [Sparassis crispa]